MTVKILITRPAASSEEFATKLRARLGQDLSIVIAPLIEIRHLRPATDISRYRTLVFTSANAVQGFAVLTENRNFDCFVVGPNTAEAALHDGFKPHEGPGTAQELAQDLLRIQPPEPILYVRGTHVAFDLSAHMRRHAAEIEDVVVYEQVAKSLSNKAASEMKEASSLIVPLFSPRTARIFSDQCKTDARLFIGAMSKSVADHITSLKLTKLTIADKPTSCSMVDVTERLFHEAIHLEGGGTAQ